MNMRLLKAIWIALIALNLFAAIIAVSDTRRKSAKLESVNSQIEALRELAIQKDSTRAASLATTLKRFFSDQLNNYSNVSELLAVSLLVSLIGFVWIIVQERKDRKRRLRE